MLQVEYVAAVFLWYSCNINVYIETIFIALAKNKTFPEKIYRLCHYIFDSRAVIRM